MGRNDHYWIGRETRAKAALAHMQEMEQEHANFIDHSVRSTKVYDHPTFTVDIDRNKPNTVSVEVLDSVSAILQYTDISTHLAVLNFASFKNPGGAFTDGSKAQEECLCHESTLYNVLSKQMPFYEANRGMLNRSLYQNRGLYSPDILFERGEEARLCDVITVAAPNKFAAQKYCEVTDAENSRVLEERIAMVLGMAMENGVDTLVLGAYGCGVFGQDPREVAEIFRGLLMHEYAGCFEQVVFAIPNGKDGNLEAFRSVFQPEAQRGGKER